VNLFRRRKLPLARRPRLEPDERVVAWAGATGDEVVVVTNRGVWLPGTGGRLSWHEIHKATWSGRQLALVPAREVDRHDGYAIVEDLPSTVHTLLDPDRVPGQVRARVTRSIAYSAHHPLPGGGGARVVARRVTGVDGLHWTVRLDPPTDFADAEIRALTSQFVAQARAGLGGAGR
jgi:hypothetical protein